MKYLLMIATVALSLGVFAGERTTPPLPPVTNTPPVPTPVEWPDYKKDFKMVHSEALWTALSNPELNNKSFQVMFNMGTGSVYQGMSGGLQMSVTEYEILGNVVVRAVETANGDFLMQVAVNNKWVDITEIAGLAAADPQAWLKNQTLDDLVLTAKTPDGKTLEVKIWRSIGILP